MHFDKKQLFQPGLLGIRTTENGLTETDINDIQWNKVHRLSIEGKRKGNADNHLIDNQVFADNAHEYVHIARVSAGDIATFLDRCSNLKALTIRNSGLTNLNVERTTDLRELVLSNNHKLVNIQGVEKLKRLRKLDLTGTRFCPGLDLNEFDQLEELHLDHTSINRIILHTPLVHMKSFHACYTHLSDTQFLLQMPAIRVVDLSNTDIVSLPEMKQFRDLEQLIVSGTRLVSLPQLDRHMRLKFLNISATEISSLDEVEFPQCLTYLNIGGSLIHKLPDTIGKLTQLQTLDLSELSLDELPLWLPDLGLEFSLGWGAGICLRDTTIKGVDMSIFDQPRTMVVQWFEKHNKQKNTGASFIYKKNSISHVLGQLRFNDIFGDTRDIIAFDDRIRNNRHVPISLRDWTAEDRILGYSLRDIPEVWINESDRPTGSIFDGNWDPRIYRQLIECRRGEQVFADNDLTEFPDEEVLPLNEVKVVFLGDGEAGKSHTIARLLLDGVQTESFPGVSTPGIVIQDRTYDVDNRKIWVHFWDFGGQEILHSMHRMFLTQETLYVVMVNVREGNQDERARYWLHNINAFAKGAPVLLVLNKMDMNRNASVNENDLRSMYPHLTEIVKMSALADSKEEFESNLIAALKRQISAIGILESPFLPSWRRLKQELQNMTDSYLRGRQYAILSERCGVEKDDGIRKALLSWFGKLGVCFHYDGSAKLEDYVVLRPEWITNAVYIIIFNKIDEIKDGLVSHETIYRLLNPPMEEADKIRCAVPDAKYGVDDVEYVLKVIRKFRLSFQVAENLEFIPMLCDNNSKAIAQEYADDLSALEFQMVYEYLPSNVLHRLMVDRHRELDRDNVWFYGARFVYGDTGISAVVKSEGNVLRIIVQAKKTRYKADMYLGILKDDLDRINHDMGLCIKESLVAYKTGRDVEYFNYDMLRAYQDANLPQTISMKTRKLVNIADILKQTDHQVGEKRQQLILDLARACETMQDNEVYWAQNEDRRTTYIRDLLSQKYFVLDQHRSGSSESGIQAGELDLDIRLEKNVEWTIFEALNIRGKGKNQLKNWDNHLWRLLNQYNAIGRPFVFHVSYMEAPKEAYNQWFQTFYSHLRQHSPKNFLLQPQFIREVPLASKGQMQNAFLRAVEAVYDCGGSTMTVYHYFVRVAP